MSALLQRRRRGIAGNLAAFFALTSTFAAINPHAAAGEGRRPPCKDRAAATGHFNKGLQLYEQKDLDRALAAFRDSHLVCPSENNTLNIALLLKELDRPVEALDMLDVLERDFPSLAPENAETSKELRAKLDQLVGTVIFDGDYPGARIIIDGKEVATMPQVRPIRLTSETHTARIEMTGYRPLDTTFYVLPKGNVQVAVALAKAPAVREDPRAEDPILPSLQLGVGLALTPGLGGQVSNCDDECSAPPGLGALVMGGYRHPLIPSVWIGATAGYVFLWQARSRTGARLTNGQFADVSDSLYLNALFAGPEISTSFYSRGERLSLGFALGPIGGPLVNSREAQNGRSSRDGPTSFDFVPASELGVSGFGGLFISLQASWRTRWSLAPGWPLQLTLGLFGFAPMNVPELTTSFKIAPRDNQGPSDDVTFRERILGSWAFIFVPSVTVYHDL
ncbi:hypothetical protein WMF20_27610 [Sorangium sp. So ce834]|uniref:hypothetical protein n=1 Tax=Sorangium sp. So ce834 TaxID=3133321 RepID=UPI003F5EDACC